MIRTCTLIVGLATLANIAIAEPRFYLNPYPPGNRMVMQSIDSALPNIEIREHAQGNEFDFHKTYHMHIGELPIASCSGGWEPQFYNIQAPASVAVQPHYGDPQGMLIDAATPDWTEIHKPCTDGPWGVALPLVRTQYGQTEQCNCEDGDPYGFAADEIRYLPFRWQHLGSDDWYYGWAAFKVILFDAGCFDDCAGQSFTVQGARVEHIGFSLESTPNTPVILGGGLCPGDINYDAEVDNFDVFDFIEHFNTQSPAADIDEDGIIDIFDVFGFITDYNTPCPF